MRVNLRKRFKVYGVRLRVLGWLGLCGESTLRHPHRGFAVATLQGTANDGSVAWRIRTMMCKDHAIGATQMLIKAGGTAVIQ